MIHEMRRGPLSELDLIPQRHYYGTQTSSSFFVVTLSELWHWTGDTDLVRTYLDAALRTFEWTDRYGDRDGDGFLEYERRSPRGLKNHGWKDSDEAIRYPDGERSGHFIVAPNQPGAGQRTRAEGFGEYGPRHDRHCFLYESRL